MRMGLLSVMVVGGIVVGCARDSKRSEAPAPSVQKAEVASKPRGVDHTPRDYPGLHNVVPVTPKLISGALPEGDVAFDELKAMGIVTIISVDGAAPEVEAAESRGMRYVHIPLRYEGYTTEQQLELARAVRDLPGPIYIHCHHGKHRSPAAAASAAVLLGELTPDEAVAMMKRAGTAPTYKGLYQCVATAVVADVSVVNAVPADFVAVAQVTNMVEAMVEADHTFEHLKAVKEHGWRVPPDHPDLVPVAEAGRLADALRVAAEDPACAAESAEFSGLMLTASRNVEALEKLLESGTTEAAVLDAAFVVVQKDCKSCHVTYRD